MNSILPNYTTSFSNCKGGKNRVRRRKKGCKPTVFAVHKIVTNYLEGNLCKSIAKVGNLWYTNRAWCDEAGSCCGQQVISVEHVRQSDAGGTEPESLIFKGFARCLCRSFEVRTPSSFRCRLADLERAAGQSTRG